VDRSNTVKALPTIISTLKAQGYRFVTIPELLKMAVGQPGY
jgi:peptidoglycan/xylan/chitin deacetylase (PgdA/CDA1 family)